MRQPEWQSKIWKSRERPGRDVREPNLLPGRFVREMRGSTSAVAALFLVAGLCRPCFAQVATGPTHVQRGIVTTIDSAMMNFGCRGATGDRFYWVSRATQFRVVQLAAARARRSGQAHHEGIILSLSKDEASG